MKDIKINKGTGAGGVLTNTHGLNFEEKTYLKEWIAGKGFVVQGVLKSTKRSKLYEVYDGQKKLIGYYGQQSMLYNALKIVIGATFTDQYLKDKMSKKINPDAFIINVQTKTLHVFEKKWQQSSGSVDEKVQTAPFKVKMFEELLEPWNFKVTYQYILSNYFARSEYRNVKEYYKKHFANIKTWVADEDGKISSLNIEDYLKNDDAQ